MPLKNLEKLKCCRFRDSNTKVPLLFEVLTLPIQGNSFDIFPKLYKHTSKRCRGNFKIFIGYGFTTLVISQNRPDHVLICICNYSKLPHFLSGFLGW